MRGRARRPDNEAARQLQADTLERRGDPVGSGPWRDFSDEQALHDFVRPA